MPCYLEAACLKIFDPTASFLRPEPRERLLQFFVHVSSLQNNFFFCPTKDYVLLNHPNLIARVTALTMAISKGHTETVRALLESGALLEKNVLADNGADIGSHVHVAILNGHVDTCRLLLQATAIEARARGAQT